MVAPKKSSQLFSSICLAFLGASFAMASPIPCADGSLSLYAPLTALSPSVACQFQDLVFTFSFQELQYQKDPSQTALLPGDRIENHVAINFINPSPGEEGLQLSPTDYPWFSSNGNTADVNFTYSVSVATPGMTMTGATFDVTAVVTGRAAVAAGETICCPSGTSGSPQPLQFTINQFITGTSADSQPFSRDVTNAGVNKDLILASVGAGDQVFLSSFDQTFQVGVPEPGVFILTAGGLAGLLLFRRRKSISKGLSLIALFGIAAVASHASPVCTAVGPTLDLYIAAGSCTINTTLFTFGPSAYTYTFSGGPGVGASVSASSVGVTVLTSVNDPGFQFVGQWLTSGAQTGDLTMQFDATAAPFVNSATFTTTTSQSAAGTVGGSSTVTNGVPPGSYVFPSGGMPIPVAPGIGSVTLTAIVNLKGNGNSTFPSTLFDNAHLSNLVMTVDVPASIPEPMTSVLLGGGLIGLSLLGRKRLLSRK